MTTQIESDEEWTAKVTRFGVEEPDPEMGEESFDDADIDVAQLMSDEDDDPAPDGVVQLDDDDDPAGPDAPDRRFDHKVAWGFGGLAAAGVVAALVAAVAFYSHDSRPAQPAGGSLSEPQAVAVAKPAPTSPRVAPGADRPLPYTADAKGSCAAGSTPAQTMSGNDPRNAFVCVRGGGDGQTITIDLGRSYVITAICLTPGWVGQDGSGVSQWSQHRVVTLVQYMFDDDPTSLMVQDTKNIHGEAVQPVKHQVASRIQILIRQTSRPPAEPPQPSTTPTPGGGGLPNIFGDALPSVSAAPPVLALDPLTGQPTNTNSDPVDATFAVSSLKILGHEAV
jgi:hypothetical protein